MLFAVGFVPDRRDFDAQFLGFDESGELRFALVSETIADAHAEFGEFMFSFDYGISDAAGQKSAVDDDGVAVV